jgi:hypothetical protein
MKHHIPEYLENLKQVAEDIGDMPYDKMAYFLYMLQIKLEKDSLNDKRGGRFLLSDGLKKASIETCHLKERFLKIWDICKKHMPKE